MKKFFKNLFRKRYKIVKKDGYYYIYYKCWFWFTWAWLSLGAAPSIEEAKEVVAFWKSEDERQENKAKPEVVYKD